MSNDFKLDHYDKRRIDTLTDEMHFRELFRLASEVCFGRQLDLKQPITLQDEVSRTIAKLGVRGLRCLFDSDSDFFVRHGWDGRNIDEEGNEEYCWIDTPYRRPDATSDEPKLHLVREARQFGEELLSTAYSCLGQGVHEKIREFREATTDAVQLDIMLWLYRRLNKLAYGDRGLALSDETEGDGFYHPLRLSPLAIGKYPNHQLSTTCLGVSVIAASFFEKAGVDHMHAGVMRTAAQAQYDALHVLLCALEVIADERQVLLTDAVRQKLASTASRIDEKLSHDAGFHAANLVRLSSGVWATLDANFHVLSYDEVQDANKDRSYKTLKSYEESAPGLELSLYDCIIAPAVSIGMGLNEMKTPQYSDAELGRILCEEDESIPEVLYRVVVPELKQRLMGENPETTFDSLFEKYSQKAFYDCLEKYVFWGESLEQVRKRVRRDGEYLARRVEDLKNIWVPVIASIAVQATRENAEHLTQRDHDLVEVGLPAQRIGLAVLKDFDEYCGGDISPGFWVSNWASQVPVIDSIAKANKGGGRPGQYGIALSHAAGLDWSHLCYEKSRGIVNLFISKHNEEEEDAAG